MMSEQELYEIARQRIDRRNRRWTLWSVNLAGLIFSLALLIFLGETALADAAAAFFMAWGGVFTLHTILAAMAQSRDGDIENEVAKLRNVFYEKPKRLELSDDGELVEMTEAELESERRAKQV